MIYKPIKADLVAIKRIAKHKRKKVKDMNTPDGKNIFKNMKGHENEINYDLYDLTPEETGFKRLVFVLNIIYPGKVGKEYKMTTGHSHKGQDEFYFFLKGRGKMILISPKGKKIIYNVKPDDLVTVPSGWWHRAANNSNAEFIFINFFEGKLPKSRK
jgi:oxalate decarboxylase/phosphoglucose isomerase-like protein (cupin superfamily)